MRSRNRPENSNDHDEDCASRDRVSKQCDSLIASGETLGHDSRTDDGRNQQSRTETFGQ